MLSCSLKGYNSFSTRKQLVLMYHPFRFQATVLAVIVLAAR